MCIFNLFFQLHVMTLTKYPSLSTYISLLMVYTLMTLPIVLMIIDGHHVMKLDLHHINT